MLIWLYESQRKGRVITFATKVLLVNLTEKQFKEKYMIVKIDPIKQSA